MASRAKISIPLVDFDGSRPLVSKSKKIEAQEIVTDINALIESLATQTLNIDQHASLRSYIFAHYHPELKIKMRVRIYQAVKEALEDENLNELRDIAGIRKKSAYINTISNVGKRSSYFGGLIGVTVAGYFFLPPIVKFGVVPVAKRTIRKLIPKQVYLTPIDKSLKLTQLIQKNPAGVYAGIYKSLGVSAKRAGRPVTAKINTTAMDDLVGNLFFRSLIELSSFNEQVRTELRKRAQIAFMYDMARVSRQLEGLARTPSLAWERIFHYTNFAMFLKSMESKEVPIQAMLQQAVETISRANIGKKKNQRQFYAEFERGLRHLNYCLQVVEPLDKLNEEDVYDEIESEEAKLAFFEQNRLVMERLYMGFENELQDARPMFEAIKQAAISKPTKKPKSEEEIYRVFRSKVKSIISKHSKCFKTLGEAELKSYDAELGRL